MTKVTGTHIAGAQLTHAGFMGADPTFEAMIEAGVDYLGADSGSTDAGPGYLGADKGMVYRPGIKQTLEYLLNLTVPRGIKLLLGSANMGGTRKGVELFREIVDEIAAEQGLKFRAAYIDSELEKSFVAAKVREGAITALDGLPALTEKTVEDAQHIVGMMGAEPYVAALEQGADVIVGGRTSDPALFAAVPIWKGIPPNVAWHCAKVVDHGFLSIEPEPGERYLELQAKTWVTATAEDDHFTIQATNRNSCISTLRVARTTLYENTNPILFYEPGGRIDIAGCQYEQVDSRTVKVTGSEFTPLPYSIKLEGATCVGHRAITVCGFRNERVVATMQENLSIATANVHELARVQGINPSRYALRFRPYGLGQVLRELEPEADAPVREVCVIGEVVADEPETAFGVVAMARLELHKLGFDAFPFSPNEIECGPVYEWSVWHLMSVTDPLECCAIEMVNY
jgi:hypothetical protein